MPSSVKLHNTRCCTQSTDNMQHEHSFIEDLSEDASYTYLVIEENAGKEHKVMRTNISNEYFKRIKIICKMELTYKNKVQCINQLTMPVISYSFGIVDWPQYQIKSIINQ